MWELLPRLTGPILAYVDYEEATQVLGPWVEDTVDTFRDDLSVLNLVGWLLYILRDDIAEEAVGYDDQGSVF